MDGGWSPGWCMDNTPQIRELVFMVFVGICMPYILNP